MKTCIDENQNQKFHYEKNGLHNDEQVEQQCLWEKQQQVSLYSHLKKRKCIPKLLTFYVQQPVYKQYAHINLSKATIKKRIFRQRSITDHQKTFETQKINNTKIENKNKWKESIEKYIEIKQKNVEKFTEKQDIQGYPLMKLTKMNERLRKIKTHQEFGDKKPQFIQKLEKQELFTQKPLGNRKSLPSISMQSSKKMTDKPKKNKNNPQNSIQKFNNLHHNSPSLFYRNHTHLVRVKQAFKQKEKKKLFFKEITSASNKSEKVIINFIGNYFREKFCPQRRYAYQRSYNKFDQDLTVKIS